MICSFQAYSKSDHNRMPGNEFGSAKWGEVRAFNEKYAARTEETKSGLSPENKVLSQNVRFRYDSDTLRNNNIVVVGGSGAGKTAFFLTPNLMSLHDCNIYTDPKGRGCGWRCSNVVVLKGVEIAENMCAWYSCLKKENIMKNQQELIDEYLYYCLKQRKLDEKTVRAYRIDLRQFSEFCVQKKLVTEKAIIRQYILHLHESYKQKTVKRKVASIKAFYSYLEDEEIIDDSPLRKIRTEFREEKILPRSIPYSILQSLLSSMYSKKSIESTISEKKLLNRDIAVVETLFSTGIRISELCNLMKKNIDIEQGIFCIKGKGGKERYLQIGTGEVLAQLKEYKRHWEKELNLSEFFFLNRYGERYSEQSARRMIQRYTQEAMIEMHITPHMFRHAFATLLLEEEVDIRFIQKMLGHASIMTTQIYAEVALKKQMEILKMKHPRNRMEILEKHIETEGKGVV